MAIQSVMIIEDDEIAAEILQKYIHHYSSDIHIEWSWNGYEALVRIQEVRPQIIFLDYMMPKFDGLEFLKSIKELNTIRDTKIAIISAYVDKYNEDKFISLGADFVLPKPIKFDQIAGIQDKI